MSYQVGSICEDCLNSGLQNHLKHFYINLEEQIVKCESSSCMFPYLRKTTCNPMTDASITEHILNLDDFIEENARKLSTADTDKQDIKSQVEELKTEDIPIMFDFASLFTDKSIKEETTRSDSSHFVHTNKNEHIQIATIKTEDKTRQIQVPPKARITRCLSNVKSNSKKVSKAKTKKTEPVLVIEPQSGKTMRPLDLIQHYMKNKSK